MDVRTVSVKHVVVQTARASMAIAFSLLSLTVTRDARLMIPTGGTICRGLMIDWHVCFVRSCVHAIFGSVRFRTLFVFVSYPDALCLWLCSNHIGRRVEGAHGMQPVKTEMEALAKRHAELAKETTHLAEEVSLGCHSLSASEAVKAAWGRRVGLHFGGST